MQDLNRTATGKQEKIFLNDLCFRDSLEAIRKFVVARKRADEREANKKWGLSS